MIMTQCCNIHICILFIMVDFLVPQSEAVVWKASKTEWYVAPIAIPACILSSLISCAKETLLFITCPLPPSILFTGTCKSCTGGCCVTAYARPGLLRLQ